MKESAPNLRETNETLRTLEQIRDLVKGKALYVFLALNILIASCVEKKTGLTHEQMQRVKDLTEIIKKNSGKRSTIQGETPNLLWTVAVEDLGEGQYSVVCLEFDIDEYKKDRSKNDPLAREIAVVGVDGETGVVGLIGASSGRPDEAYVINTGSGAFKTKNSTDSIQGAEGATTLANNITLKIRNGTEVETKK